MLRILNRAQIVMSKCDVYVILTEILINSQLKPLIHKIDWFTQIDFQFSDFIMNDVS